MRTFENETLRKALGRTLLTLATAFTVALAGEARADFGNQGTLAIGVERLFGLVGTNTNREGVDIDTTTFSFLWGSPATYRPYSRPRAAVDYFVIDRLSVGGSLGFYTWSQAVDGDDFSEGTGFLFAPRAGYIIDITDDLAFWPRGGFTFVQDDIEGPGGGATDVETSATALSLEAPLVIQVAQGLAIDIALTLDIGLGGEEQAVGPDIDQEHNEYGIQFGITGFL